MNWHMVDFADVPPLPWRNGGGVTRELVCWPDPENWIWRMSVAEVTHSGPFSRFDGVQRWFAVLAGAGVRLSMGGHTHALTCRDAPLCFDGAVPVDCQLLGGATQDFNLMVRSDSASARMTRVAGELKLTLDTPKVIAIYPMDTRAVVHFDQYSCELAPGSLAWQTREAGATVRVSAANALLMEVDVWT